MKGKNDKQWIVELAVEMVKRGAEYAAEHAEEIAGSFSGGKKRKQPKKDD